LSFLIPIIYWELQVIVLVSDVVVSVTESRFIIMTYSARTQRKPALSVRTRALIHKYHERIITQRVMGWNSCEMRLRARLNNCVPWEVTTRSTSAEDRFSKVNSDDVTSEEIPAGSVASEIAALGGESRAPVSQTGSSACSTASTESGSIVQCKWDGCGSSLEQSQLVTHIQHVHVLPQMVSNRRKCFACLWRDCRVYRRPSVSAAWLESHILHHTDAKGKPFRCIFDGCTLRFSTSILLERHVQRAHMRVTRTQTGSLPAQLTNTLSSVNESPKLITSTAGQSSNGALGQITASPTQNGKRSSRRRRRVRNYRVRRPDFYDRRSHYVIQNRLKLGHLLGSSEYTVGLRSDDDFQHRRMPKPLMVSPSKPRLRSANGCPPTSFEKNTPSPSSELRRNRLAMLLTMPHT
ncbi:zinc finger, C2H2 type, partial [Opisthorchis viverrini]